MSFDREELLEEIDNDREMLGQMLEIFARDANERMERMRAAIDSGDAAALMEDAHALKGGAGNFFATDVFETAYQLEAMGRENQLEQAGKAYADLSEQLAQLKSDLKSLIAGN